MTPEEMRALDARVAGEVMSWTELTPPSPRADGLSCSWRGKPKAATSTNYWVPCFCQEIEAAWRVVKQLRSEGWLVIVKEMPEGFPYLAGDDWTRDPKVHVRSYVSAQWMPLKTAEDCRRFVGLHPDGMGDSAPVAICRCALRVRELTAKFGGDD